MVYKYCMLEMLEMLETGWLHMKISVNEQNKNFLQNIRYNIDPLPKFKNYILAII